MSECGIARTGSRYSPTKQKSHEPPLLISLVIVLYDASKEFKIAIHIMSFFLSFVYLPIAESYRYHAQEINKGIIIVEKASVAEIRNYLIS